MTRMQMSLGLPMWSDSSVDTSRAAAAQILASQDRMVAEVFAAVQAAGSGGLTCQEVEDLLGMLHQTASARIYDLHEAGGIIDSGQRRTTRSQRWAIVWVVPPEPEQPSVAPLDLDAIEARWREWEPPNAPGYVDVPLLLAEVRRLRALEAK